MDDQIIFTTVHGSHLYGLAHAGSDRDVFVVTTSERTGANHNNGPELDSLTIGITTFLTYAASGSHQSLEAMFSPVKEWGPAAARFRPIIDGFRAGGAAVTIKYERTIRKFCFGTFKQRRHAVRLSLNLEQMRAEFRFDPQLTSEQADRASQLATDFTDEELSEVLLPGRKIPA
jgi:hypothetical protein